MHIFALAASASCSNPHVLACTLRFSARRFLASAKIYTLFKAFLLTFFSFISFTSLAIAEEGDHSKRFDTFTVHYSVFSSTAISAEMAQRYGLVRAKDRVYVNIAVVPNDREYGGVNAAVSGKAKNLIQQEKPLEFLEIAEQGATYYLAPLRHTDREVFHFLITVDPPGTDGPYTLKFTQELYVNP